MNEQVVCFVFFFICSNKCRCFLERGQQVQVTGNVNKKGSTPFDAQLEAIECHIWGTEPSFKSFLVADAMVISLLFAWQLQLTEA